MKLIPGHLYFDKGDHKTRVYVGQYAITPRKTAVERYYLFGIFNEHMDRSYFLHYTAPTLSSLAPSDTMSTLSIYLSMLYDARKVVIGDSMIITTMVDISPADVRTRV